MNDNKKRELIGVVVSDKADKTITVKVETYKMNPIYKKRVKRSKKFAAHKLPIKCTFVKKEESGDKNEN